MSQETCESFTIDLHSPYSGKCNGSLRVAHQFSNDPNVIVLSIEHGELTTRTHIERGDLKALALEIFGHMDQIFQNGERP